MADQSASSQLPVAIFVDDDKDFLNEIRFVAESTGFCRVVTLADSSRLMEELGKGGYSALFMDWVMPGVTGSDLLPVISKSYPLLPVVIMTGVSDVNTVVSCMKQGALDYITKPLDSNRIISCLANALKISELSNQNRQLREYLLGSPLERPESFCHIIGSSEKMQSLFKLIEAISQSRYPVFITGETGVGKELIASAVHRSSGLQGKLVALNVAGLDPSMFDDTLFGHRKGAYTGASDSRGGLITQAQGGTLFLDEIGDLGHQSQVKLLRLLQENEYYRLGSDLIQRSDARIVAASNRDFTKLIAEGKFREDLYHRLCYHRLHIPPLRDRREDIMPLAVHFAERAAGNIGKIAPEISTYFSRMLSEYDYPGNVRELESIISHAVVVSSGPHLTHEDFPGLTMHKDFVDGITVDQAGEQFRMRFDFSGFPRLEQVERIIILEAIKLCGGRKGVAADILGITRQTLRRKLEESEGGQGVEQ